MDIKTFLKEFWLFGVKQAYACLFGGFLLALMLITKFWYPLEGLHRYDFIFLAAIVFQLFLIVFRLETWREFTVILVFHIVATVMELFKTSDAIRAWVYPEEYVFGIANVPLLLGWFLVALFIWFAENIATYANIWIYPNQTDDWEMVSVAKLSSWFLLMLLSFVLVASINQLKIRKAGESEEQRVKACP